MTDFIRTMFRGTQMISRQVFSRFPFRLSSLLANNTHQYFPASCYRQTYQSIHTSSYLFDIHTVNVPAFPESISDGDVIWKKEVGDTVVVDEVIAEVETDKTAIPVMSPVSGVITERLFEDGDKVTYNQPLAKIDEREVAVSEVKKPEEVPKAAEPAPVEVKSSRPSTPTVVEPKPAQFTPSPPASRPNESSSPAPFSLISAFPAGVRTEQRVKMTRIRMRTADRLKEAQNTCAMLTTFNEIDMSNLIEMRNQYKDAFQKKHGVKLGIMSSFSKAAAFALQDQPIVNAYIDGDQIVYRNYVDISIAVASPKGLVVPVLRNVESMDFAAIEKNIFELGEKAKEGHIAVEDMDGGTFTISNGGIFGSLFSTPIVNPPQSAILGLHGTFERPVVRNGQIVIRPMMYVALSYDHRLVDGREAVLFLRKIKSFVEDPRVFFMSL
nr:dihydrolipoyllysine residue succinyltransferase [Hymenolepis microstoma]